MVYWRALLAWSLEYTVDAGVYLSAAMSCCTPCSTFPSGVTNWRVSLWCLNLMVSYTITTLVSLETTNWQRQWSIAAPIIHPFLHLKSQEWLQDNFLWTISFNSKGPSGVSSYWKGPAKYSQSGIVWLNVDWRRKFNVVSVCTRRRYHRNRGKSGATPDRMAKKCTLKVRIACSAVFILWISGGTSWK